MYKSTQNWIFGDGGSLFLDVLITLNTADKIPLGPAATFLYTDVINADFMEYLQCDCCLDWDICTFVSLIVRQETKFWTRLISKTGVTCRPPCPTLSKYKGTRPAGWLVCSYLATQANWLSMHRLNLSLLLFCLIRISASKQTHLTLLSDISNFTVLVRDPKVTLGSVMCVRPSMLCSSSVTSLLLCLTLSITTLYICLTYQFLLDCQQPAATKPSLPTQVRPGRASGHR